MRLLGLIYTVIGFAVTHALFCVFIVFLLNIYTYPAVSGPAQSSAVAATAINLILIAQFGLQHSGMARNGVKRIVARFLPEPLERATYVHVANMCLALLLFGWQPVGGLVWHVENDLWRTAIWMLFTLGWALSFAGSLLIDHLQLLGMRQAWAWYKGETYTLRPFQQHWLYDMVRHPIQLGLILAFWATPDMTLGHLLLAGGLSVYILIGTVFEERDLVATFGASYKTYKTRVPGFIPRPWHWFK